jgi:hypothetical protein
VGTLCSPLKVNKRLGGTCCLHLQTVHFHRSTQHYIPEDRTLTSFKFKIMMKIGVHISPSIPLEDECYSALMVCGYL